MVKLHDMRKSKIRSWFYPVIHGTCGINPAAHVIGERCFRLMFEPVAVSSRSSTIVKGMKMDEAVLWLRP